MAPKFEDAKVPCTTMASRTSNAFMLPYISGEMAGLSSRGGGFESLRKYQIDAGGNALRSTVQTRIRVDSSVDKRATLKDPVPVQHYASVAQLVG